jgi:hypothetical protein
LTDWRDKLREAGDLAPKSINHRLEIVVAILRTGWREAEFPAPDLERGKCSRAGFKRPNIMVPR